SYPEQLPTIEYEPEDHVVRVRRTGQVSFKGLNVFVSGGLYGENVAIRPTAEDGVYDVVFIRKTLRQIDLRQRAT
ncbi:IS481 family transposase, partial [Pseudomonas guguanensis]